MVAWKKSLSGNAPLDFVHVQRNLNTLIALQITHSGCLNCEAITSLSCATFSLTNENTCFVFLCERGIDAGVRFRCLWVDTPSPTPAQLIE